jgi:hypothetical protein
MACRSHLWNMQRQVATAETREVLGHAERQVGLRRVEDDFQTHGSFD